MMADGSLSDRSFPPAAKRKRRRALQFWLYVIAVFVVALLIFDAVGLP
jgi:hypothetical protein